MKIFVTGATGYIGQKLVARLLEEGHEIHALCRTIPQDDFFRNTQLKIFEGDLLNVEVMERAMMGCEHVYHTAAYARVWAKDPATYFEINVRGTVNILELALKHGIKKVVVTSSASIYGVSNGSPIHEDTVRMVDFFSEYESSKFLAEDQVQQYVRKGLHAVLVHPSRVYGPGIWTESNVVSQLIKLYLTGEWHIIPGTGKSIGCYCYIDDVVNGHLLAMEHGRSGERYILGGENTDFCTFFSTLKKLSKKSYLTIKVPTKLLLLYAWQEELLATWFGKTPMITRRWVKKYNYHLSLSSDKAIRELGYTITPFETGISRTLEWLKNDCHVFY